MPSKPTSLALSAVLILVGWFVLLSSPLWAVHQVSWMPSQLVQEVMAGDSATIQLLITAERSALPNTVVEVSPELAGFVSVAPSELGTIPRGKSITLALTISPPGNASPETIYGEVRLRRKDGEGRVFLPELPTTVSIKWQTVTNRGGFTVAVPPNYAATEIDQTKTVLEPTPEARAAGALPVVVEVDKLRRGPTLRDHLESLGIDPQNIEEVALEGRIFLKAVDNMGDGLEDVSFSILSPPNNVLYVSTFSSEFAVDPRFQAIVKSLSF